MLIFIKKIENESKNKMQVNKESDLHIANGSFK
jgi:hypothetical protein